MTRTFKSFLDFNVILVLNAYSTIVSTCMIRFYLKKESTNVTFPCFKRREEIAAFGAQSIGEESLKGCQRL